MVPLKLMRCRAVRAVNPARSGLVYLLYTMVVYT